MDTKQKSRFYSFLFLLAFLTAQFSIIHHTADHGVLEHSHLGEQCEECTFAKNYNADATSSFSIEISLTEYKILHVINSDLVISNNHNLSPPVRGPPIFS